MLASMFVMGGINSLRQAPALAGKAKPVADTIAPALAAAMPQVPIPTDPATWVRINGAIHVVGGLMLATGHVPRLTSWTLAGTLVPTTFIGHAFWKQSDKAERQNQSTHFFKNLSMIGGLLIAAVDIEPSARERVELAARRVKRRVSPS